MWGIVTCSQLLQRINDLNAKVDILMSQQDEINTAAQQIETDVAAQNAATQAIKDAITALEAQVAAGQPADLSALKAAVSDLDAATASEQAAVPPPAG